MVAEVLAWNLHRIVSHGKNGSPTTYSNQAGNFTPTQGSLRPHLPLGPSSSRRGVQWP